MFRFLALVVLATPAMAQHGPSCPELVGAYGPPGGPTDYADMMADPLPDALAGIAACEVALIPAHTALVRARYSDDPTLRPALRDVVDAWRTQAHDVIGLAYVALAALGERPDYFVDEAERALADGLGTVAQRAASVSMAFPDSSRYERLRRIGAEYDTGLTPNYWVLAETFTGGLDEFVDPAFLDPVYDEKGFRLDFVRSYPLQTTIEDALLGLFDIGFRSTSIGGGTVVFGEAPDSFTPENVMATTGLRVFGASDPEAVRVAIEQSPSLAVQLAQWGQGEVPVEAVEVYRRMIFSAFLPGESLTSDVFPPPADGSLYLNAFPAAVVVSERADGSFSGSAFRVSGQAHDSGGVPIGNSPPVRALVAPDDDALQAVLSALSARQRARLDGAAEARPLVISPASWAETLAARATVTLDGRPGSVGTFAAPVVAYAPDGVRLDGRFEGVGVLVADGLVVLRGNARWTGLIVARGGLDVSGSAAVVGGATVGGPLAVGGRARILYSPAALALARDAALAE